MRLRFPTASSPKSSRLWRGLAAARGSWLAYVHETNTQAEGEAVSMANPVHSTSSPK